GSRVDMHTLPPPSADGGRYPTDSMHSFAANRIETQIVAPDVQRDILVLDDSTLDRGYVTARTRTFNVTCTPVNNEDRPDYGDPEIVRIQTAWNYDPDRKSTIPVVAFRDLQDCIQNDFPDATFSPTPVNDDFGSWRLRVSHEQSTIEYAWGPLSGFGGTDLTQLTDELTFDYCDLYFHSVVDAVIYAMEKLGAPTQNRG
ncbi:MAG: hypothetical protein WKF77_29810, partial [Planctomycetaceae bacterium]